MILKTFNITKRRVAGVAAGKIYNCKINLMCCDKCGGEWEERAASTKKKLKKRSDHLCKKCLTPILNATLVEAGTKALKSIPPEQRKINASKAGKISQKTGKPAKTWFSTERWEALPEDKQKQIVSRANAAAQERLNNMTDEEKAAHYTKVLKGGIGYISKGQRELFSKIAGLGFLLEHQISDKKVDMCHPERKIIIEYNGDAFHCNPKFWKSNDYSTLIKMHAYEKWTKDRCRYNDLRKRGYTVLIVWESDWLTNPEAQINRVIKIYENHADYKNREAIVL